jgi:hypothetical protein
MSSPAASRRDLAYTAKTGWHEVLTKRYGKYIKSLERENCDALEGMKRMSYKKCSEVLEVTKKTHLDSLKFFYALRLVDKILKTDLELYMPYVKSILSRSENSPAPTRTSSRYLIRYLKRRTEALRFHKALVVVEEILKTDPKMYKPSVERILTFY